MREIEAQPATPTCGGGRVLQCVSSGSEPQLLIRSKQSRTARCIFVARDETSRVHHNWVPLNLKLYWNLTGVSIISFNLGLSISRSVLCSLESPSFYLSPMFLLHFELVVNKITGNSILKHPYLVLRSVLSNKFSYKMYNILNVLTISFHILLNRDNLLPDLKIFSLFLFF